MADRPCGNPKCRTSTGIHEGLTFGSGILDQNGYWSRPCRVCAEHHDKNRDTIIQDTIKSLKAEGKPHDIVTLRRQHDWLFIPAWPFARTALRDYSKEVKVFCYDIRWGFLDDEDGVYPSELIFNSIHQDKNNQEDISEVFYEVYGCRPFFKFKIADESVKNVEVVEV